MKYLIADLNIALNGHKLGFVQNLVHYIKNNPSDNQYIIFTNYSKNYKIDALGCPNVKIKTTTEEQQNEQKHTPSFLKRMALQWRLIRSECEVNKVDHLVLMELDRYQIEIGRKKTNFTISGIWFRPYSRMEAEAPGLLPKIQLLKTKFQKKLTMAMALRNCNLKKVFILNDEKMPDWLNKSGQTRFAYLADPCFQYATLPNFNLRAKYNIPAENLILLQFGFIDRRKNSENIIAALNAAQTSRITLLILGKFEENYEEILRNLKAENSHYQLILRDEFLSDEEMESTFQQADVILRTNINFFGSSGIVGIAANHNKPCIVSDYGVMADQVEKYKMGEIVNPTDINQLKNVILSFLNLPEKRICSGKAYVESHTADIFAETLFKIS